MELKYYRATDFESWDHMIEELPRYGPKLKRRWALFYPDNKKKNKILLPVKDLYSIKGVNGKFLLGYYPSKESKSDPELHFMPFNEEKYKPRPRTVFERKYKDEMKVVQFMVLGKEDISPIDIADKIMIQFEYNESERQKVYNRVRAFLYRLQKKGLTSLRRPERIPTNKLPSPLHYYMQEDRLKTISKEAIHYVHQKLKTQQEALSVPEES